jgi:hypothetical protein
VSAKEFVATLTDEELVVALEASQWALADQNCLCELDISDEWACEVRGKIRAFMEAP